MGDQLIQQPREVVLQRRWPLSLEALESRVYMHDTAPEPIYPLGPLVPWLTAPITPAAGSDNGGGTPSPPSPPPPPPPGTVVGAVTALTLINAGTNADIGAFQAG